MNDLISQKFEILGSNKAKIIEIIKSYSEEDRVKALPEKWSMIQVLRHIQVSEEGSMAYMMKKSKAGDQMKSRPLLSRFFLQILYLTFRLRFRLKAPKVVSNPKILH